MTYTDDRGVSTAVNYVLTLGITTLLVSGLLLATGGVVDDRRESTTRTSLEVVGQRLAANLMSADRLAGTDDTRTVSLSVDLPVRIAGSGYTVRVNGSSSTLVLEADTVDATRSVSFVASTPVVSTTVRGGQLRIVLTPANELEVRAA
jgi:hypothetical protein